MSSTGGPIAGQIETGRFRKPATNSELERGVQITGDLMAIGGMTRDEKGNRFLGSVRDNAVWALNPTSERCRRLFQDVRLAVARCDGHRPRPLSGHSRSTAKTAPSG